MSELFGLGEILGLSNEDGSRGGNGLASSVDVYAPDLMATPIDSVITDSGSDWDSATRLGDWRWR
jgi:hypothetical protein